MGTIRKSIDVPGNRGAVAGAWAAFIHSVLIGRRRLACGELACLDPVGRELVGFEAVDDSVTRVNVAIPAGAALGDGAADLLAHKVSRDLVLFLDYVESGEYEREHALEAAAATGLKEDVRHGRFMRHDARPDPEQFSVRRSGRA